MVQTYCYLRNSNHCNCPDFKLLSFMQDQNRKLVNSIQKRIEKKTTWAWTLVERGAWPDEDGVESKAGDFRSGGKA